MAKFFGIEIETPDEVRARLQRDFNELSSRGPMLQQAGYSVGELVAGLAGKGQRDLRNAADTERVMSREVERGQSRIAEGEDPLEVQKEGFLRAATELRPINPSASNQMLQRYVELDQIQRERRAERQRLMAESQRDTEAHEADLNNSLGGLAVLGQRYQAVINNPNAPDAAKEMARERLKEVEQRRTEILESDPNYQIATVGMNLPDGRVGEQRIAVNLRNPEEQVPIGDPTPVDDAPQDRKADEERQIKLAKFDAIEQKMRLIQQTQERLNNRLFDAQGPVEGRLPGLNQDAREYDSLSVELGTLLTPLIRPPGSGPWTDADQARLESLVPRRSDDPEVAARKLRDLQKFLDAQRAVLQGNQPSPGSGPSAGPAQPSGATPPGNAGGGQRQTIKVDENGNPL